MTKIVVLDGQTLNPGDNPWTGLLDLGEVDVYERTSADQIVARAASAEVLVINKVKLTADAIAQLPRLGLVAVTATGWDCVDGEAARRQRIVVSNVPVYGTDSVAQFVFALLLELSHHVALHDGAVKAGEWSSCGDFAFWKTPLVELAGKTMGIVGFGRIGRRVGELAHALGLSVMAHAARQTEDPAYARFAWAGLVELCEQADVISLHCPLTPQTAGMINRDLLGHMKPSAMLINTARGGLVVEVDLAEALNTGKLAAAAVDVVSAEPIRPDNPLLTAKNCLITPHIAWATLAARRRLMAATVANVAAFLAGQPINVVN